VLERRLGGDVGQEENAAAEKKSAVREREEGERSRGALSRFGGEVEESEKGLEKKAAVLEVTEWDERDDCEGDAKGEPKNALVLELGESSASGMEEGE
jgi:hypothetical protein